MWRKGGTVRVRTSALIAKPCRLPSVTADMSDAGVVPFHEWLAMARRIEACRERWVWGLSFLFCTMMTVGAALGACLWRPALLVPVPPVPEPAAIALDLVAPQSSVPTHAETVPAPADRKPVPEAEWVTPVAPALPIPKADAPRALHRSVQTHHVRSRKHQKPRTIQASLPHPSSDPATAVEAMEGHQTITSAPQGQVKDGLHGVSGSDDPGSWQARLLGRLASFRRYPAQARAEREEGTAYVRFTMDRKGHVLDVTLAQTSGNALLDSETLALVRRAEPLPEPPASIAGDSVTLTVPVEFYLRMDGADGP